MLNKERESRCGHRNGFIVQDEHTNWIQGHPIESKETSETKACLRKLLSLSQKPGIIFTGNSKKLLIAFQDLQ